MGERIDNKGAWQMPQGGVKLGKNEGLLSAAKENYLRKQELEVPVLYVKANNGITIIYQNFLVKNYGKENLRAKNKNGLHLSFWVLMMKSILNQKM